MFNSLLSPRKYLILNLNEIEQKSLEPEPTSALIC